MKKYKFGISFLIFSLLIIPFISNAYYFQKNLSVGSKGADVVELQKILIEQGFLVGRADGTFGNQTKLAVKKFQQANKFTLITGTVGVKTLAKLNEGKINLGSSQTSSIDKQKIITSNLKSEKTDCNSVSLTVRSSALNAGDQIIKKGKINFELGKFDLIPTPGCKVRLNNITSVLEVVNNPTSNDFTPTLNINKQNQSTSTFGTSGIVNPAVSFFDLVSGVYDENLENIVYPAEYQQNGILLKFGYYPDSNNKEITINRPVSVYYAGTAYSTGRAVLLPGEVSRMSLTNLVATNPSNSNDIVKVYGLPITLNNLIVSGEETESSDIKSGGVIGLSTNRQRVKNDNLAYLSFLPSSPLAVDSITIDFPENENSNIPSMNVSLIDPMTNSNWGNSKEGMCSASGCSVTFHPNIKLPAGVSKKIILKINSSILPKLRANGGGFLPRPLVAKVSALNNTLLVTPISIANVKYVAQ